MASLFHSLFGYISSFSFPSGRTTVRPPPGGKSKHALTMMEFQSPELKRGWPHGRPTDWYIEEKIKEIPF